MSHFPVSQNLKLTLPYIVLFVSENLLGTKLSYNWNNFSVSVLFVNDYLDLCLMTSKLNWLLQNIIIKFYFYNSVLLI